MTDSDLTDMSPEEFREWGHRSIDWIADYLSDLETRTVSPDVRPGSIRAQIPDMAPDTGEGMERIFSDMERVILPAITHWNSPNFFAYFPSSASGPGILGELLMAAFNTNAMIWRTSPAATELEEAVLNWLRQMLGLSDAFTGVVYDTASVSTFHAIAAARASISERDIGEDGMVGAGAPRLCMYTSQEAHSSVEKAGIALGLGRKGVRKVGVDDRFRMDAVELDAMIERDKADGWRPFCVSATVGTTSTTSVDPVEAIVSVCSKHGLWLHVDGAYAGAAAILPEKRDILAGCEHADSFVMNPHKWLFTPIDFSTLFCKRPDLLKRAFSLTPEYLQTQESDRVTNYMDYGIQLGRRFRSLKFWMVVRYFGVDGLRRRIREHIRLAKQFGEWVEDDSRFLLLLPVEFGTVCFRMNGSNEANEQLLEILNRRGPIYLSHTNLNGDVILRFSIGNVRTTEAHVEAAWRLIQTAATELGD
jgi:aromatic-L-amino-acid decarboxylase